MEGLELKDYFTILRRRRRLFFTVASIVFLISLMFALRISNYRSTATVEVATPEVSASTTVPAGMSASDYNESLVDLRISRLQQKVFSTASLIEVITKFNLYADARKSSPIADVADGMQKKIKLDLVSSTLANPSSAQKASASDLSAIAFNLSFDYNHPLIAQQVTNELVSRFLDEDLKDRRKAAHETSQFLESQIKVMEKTLEEQEKNIADFRAANGDVHPESLAFNQQLSQSLMMSIQNIDTQISTNETTLGTLRSQLATLDPYSRVVADGQLVTTPTIQLKALKTQYTTLSAQYGSVHPDVIKIKNQIEALKKQTGNSSLDSSEIKAQIEDVQTNLVAAEKNRGAKHPDVIALKKKLAGLKEELTKTQSTKAPEDNIRGDADNPSYLQIVASLKSAEEQRRALMKQKDKLLEQQEKYQKAVAANPEAEQKLASISRDYDNALIRYRELKSKKMSADMSETIEQDRSGQRLVIIDPPDLPLHTHPGKTIIILAGLVASVFLGVASVAVIQIFSQSIAGPRHLEALVGLAPLIIVPHIITLAELNSHDDRNLKKMAIAAGGVLIVLIFFAYFVMPLDVLFAVILQKLGFA